ncbi:diiron oxygenase [Streptomyces sp. NPDC046939]|uniref:diiron oxygenase n=1 Tax=Streptomyces sp. NPDC046939 TaxID=3155376 RepID=UPI0033CDEF37
MSTDMGGPALRADQNDDLSHTRIMLSRLAANWPRRAYVKKDELDPFFEAGRPGEQGAPGKEDFLEGLLPFKDLPQYQSSSPEMKSRVLSCGWLMYNAKTTQIETEIVNPSCLDIIAGAMPGLRTADAQKAVCETMVDEAYHVHLVEQASRLTRSRRGLENLHIPQFNLVRHMRERQRTGTDPWHGQMVQFATAVVSEIFISDYLHLLSESEEIQPFNRMTVAAHRHDEMVHSPLFRSMAQLFSHDLTVEQRAAFADVLAEPVVWFADRELDIWLSMLRQIGFPKAEEMIRECRSLGAADLTSLDYSEIVTLAEEIGLLDSAAARDSFARQGLITA